MKFYIAFLPSLGAAWRWTVYWEVGIFSVNNDFVVSLILPNFCTRNPL